MHLVSPCFAYSVVDLRSTGELFEVEECKSKQTAEFPFEKANERMSCFLKEGPSFKTIKQEVCHSLVHSNAYSFLEERRCS